jgi:hypothetical protein
MYIYLSALERKITYPNEHKKISSKHKIDSRTRSRNHLGLSICSIEQYILGISGH